METHTERPTLQIKVPKPIKTTVSLLPPKSKGKYIKYHPKQQAQSVPQEKPFKIYSQAALQDYIAQFDELEEINTELTKLQSMLRYLEGPLGLKEKKEDFHSYTEKVKRCTQIFRTLLWQKANWPNQLLPQSWLGLGAN